jgi:hypothetical protein
VEQLQGQQLIVLFGSKKQSEQLAADLATVPLGSVIVAAVRDEASS